MAYLKEPVAEEQGMDDRREAEDLIWMRRIQRRQITCAEGTVSSARRVRPGDTTGSPWQYPDVRNSGTEDGS
jgi:hypothetical protein